jgi:hypothetical protein
MRYITPKVTNYLNATRSIESVGQAHKNPGVIDDSPRAACSPLAYGADE